MQIDNNIPFSLFGPDNLRKEKFPFEKQTVTLQTHISVSFKPESIMKIDAVVLKINMIEETITVLIEDITDVTNGIYTYGDTKQLTFDLRDPLLKIWPKYGQNMV